MNNSSTMQDEKALLEAVRNGDNKAFDVLFEKYQLRILKLVSRYVQDPSEAYDITQESFIKAYRSIHNFRGDSAFYTWLYRIAVNTAKNHAVASNRFYCYATMEYLDFDNALGKNQYKEHGTPEHMVLSDEIEATLFEAIESLPCDMKQAITLREIEGMSYDEIANVMSCPVGTVRSRIFRARDVIDKRLRPLLSNE